jgi:hypothetical protein
MVVFSWIWDGSVDGLAHPLCKARDRAGEEPWLVASDSGRSLRRESTTLKLSLADERP